MTYAAIESAARETSRAIRRYARNGHLKPVDRTEVCRVMQGQLRRDESDLLAAWRLA